MARPCIDVYRYSKEKQCFLCVSNIRVDCPPDLQMPISRKVLVRFARCKFLHVRHVVARLFLTDNYD